MAQTARSSVAKAKSAARKSPASRGPGAKKTSASAARKTSVRKVAKKASASSGSVSKARSAARTASKKAVVRMPTTVRAAALPGERSSRPATSANNPLAHYNEKRDFARTTEPARKLPARGAAGPLQFVVQKHAASHLHYDFRLELDGVLLSWSVPKGPSLRAGERRLAVRTEDHPLSYVDFEGTIPEGEYGGGSVLVWDRGTWQAEGDARADFKRGRLTFTLHGEKLAGRFHLVRSKLGADKRENWLLFKGRDAAAHAELDIVSERPESVLSGRTMDEIDEASATVRPARKGKPRSRPEPVADMVEMVSRLSPGFALTSLDKVLFPEQGLRKAEIIAYYVSVASVMLPYVAKRPLVLVRCPEGRMQKCFYQKHIGKGVPTAVKRVRIKESSKSVEYASVEDANGLVALAQMGVLEIHMWGCHADQVEKPDLFVFDIDPDEGLSFDLVIETALLLKQTLADVGLTSFVKTTGGKGLHVVAPVQRSLSWEQHKAFSHAVVDKLARARPDRYLTNMRKDLRKGKLFLDYLRNGRGATAIAPYSTRARAGAYVATPLRWDELTHGVKPSDFDVRSLLRRLEEQKVDPWRGFLELRQTVPASALK